MNRHESSINALFALVRLGLWEDTTAHDFSDIDWQKVYQFAGEQSVVGLVTAGIERLRNANVLKTSGTSEEQVRANLNISQEVLLQLIGEVQMMEKNNLAMNQFIEKLVGKMQEAEIYTLLVKGQGIAQCYERPLWRACGDVDLFLSDSNYDKAKEYLLPMASSNEPEGRYKKHLEMTIDSWVVELHGSLRCGLSKRMDRAIDELQKDVFYGGKVRSWVNGNTKVFLPGVDCDVLFVFTHYIKHFYTEGLGLRQICDWCRLLWTYRSELDLRLLESRINGMGLMSEWRAFGAFAVEYLGMPKEAMPFFNENQNQNENDSQNDNDNQNHKLHKKAERILEFVLETGNFGHNRDMSYFNKYPYLVRKVCSFGRRLGDLVRHARIFPMDSLRFFPKIMFDGLRSAARGE